MQAAANKAKLEKRLEPTAYPLDFSTALRVVRDALAAVSPAPIVVSEGATATGDSGTPVTYPAPDPVATTGVVIATAPTEQSAPTISGTDVVGDTLTASPGAWTNAPSGYTYQWDADEDGIPDFVLGLARVAQRNSMLSSPEL